MREKRTKAQAKKKKKEEAETTRKYSPPVIPSIPFHNSVRNHL